jgi:formiminotetrahydrofolate cyclodeaminase
MKDMTVKEFLRELASDSPAPGGGSVAALGAALGAALVSMVSNLTIGKKKYKDVEEEMETLKRESNELLDRLLNLLELDKNAFLIFMDAYKLSKDTEKEKELRDAEIQKGAKGAAEVPMEIAKGSYKVMELAKIAAQKGNSNAITDAGVAALLGEAMIQAAILNVKINLLTIKDNGFVVKMSESCRELEQKSSILKKEILDMVHSAL